MNRSRLLSSALLFLVGAAFAMLPAVAPLAAPPPAQGVRITPIGAPTWMPVDFNLFSAPIGTAGSGYAEFGETMMALLPPPNHMPHPSLGVGPGAPHAPPYDSEMADGVSDQGFNAGVRFATSEFSNGAGVWLAWMNVPAPGATGSSPDFSSGPIIPNALFPIHFSGINVHNGKYFSNLGAAEVPPLDANLTPPFNVDGHSHFPVFFADNADFGPVGAKLRGSYQFQIVMTDQLGNGWRITAHFALAP